MSHGTTQPIPATPDGIMIKHKAMMVQVPFQPPLLVTFCKGCKNRKDRIACHAHVIPCTLHARQHPPRTAYLLSLQYTFSASFAFSNEWKLLQVETAEGLTIRVVNNVSQRLDVKHHFAEAFRPEGYPDGFNYQQKVCVSSCSTSAGHASA